MNTNRLRWKKCIKSFFSSISLTSYSFFWYKEQFVIEKSLSECKGLLHTLVKGKSNFFSPRHEPNERKLQEQSFTVTFQALNHPFERDYRKLMTMWEIIIIIYLVVFFIFPFRAKIIHFVANNNHHHVFCWSGRKYVIINPIIFILFGWWNSNKIHLDP